MYDFMISVSLSNYQDKSAMNDNHLRPRNKSIITFVEFCPKSLSACWNKNGLRTEQGNSLADQNPQKKNKQIAKHRV